ncbi:Mrp family chromosome partitioning ATPase [Hypnocyclicus thermotrophus]|uniref:Iron-sulfur cluster carrier protein n=1 Tax=Hypnocyclicus thermotrophus TaxID=1627895 RepID=A0AA46DZU8_9FUSO|nr:iron-sulfur cluster carrier protein MrpORP [Hypnocyclicus thermotrophus]TDT71945.1 Mrp family chromosome partitioning ATPase [Hypnocyclicus thermotrophus]
MHGISDEMQKQLEENMSKIKHKIVVMSGKGGVGKSTVSTNIAFGLAMAGKKVGLLDADLHGPNIPLMLGIEGTKLGDLSKPFQVNKNLFVVSLSFYMRTSDDPIIWRGPAKIGAIKQMLGEVIWGELDYLVVDLPPGTGDEPLTIAQELGKIDGSVIVTTPQDVAILDSRKSVKFSTLVNMPILGIVENMSGFVCPHCNKRIDIFKQGGGEKAAKELGVELLTKIPMTPGIVHAGDDGKPFIFNNKGPEVEIMKELVNKLINKVEINKEIENKEKESDKKMGNILKVAFPTNDKTNVEEHFGHCKEFVIFEIEDAKIINKSFVTPPPHEPGVIPRFLGEQGANVIITGGMGQKAIDIFKSQNIDVILGARGSIEENLKTYLEGELYSTASACNHEHDEDHSCNH